MSAVGSIRRLSLISTADAAGDAVAAAAGDTGRAVVTLFAPGFVFRLAITFLSEDQMSNARCCALPSQDSRDCPGVLVVIVEVVLKAGLTSHGNERNHLFYLRPMFLTNPLIFFTIVLQIPLKFGLPRPHIHKP
jgi:hypothetical protein